MEKSYKDTIKESVFTKDFVKVTFRGQGKFENINWSQVVIRPVKIKNRLQYQFSFFDNKKDITKNFKEKEAYYQLSKILLKKLTNIVIIMSGKTLQYEFKAKGAPVMHVHKNEATPSLLHDRQKSESIPLNSAFLKIIGLTTVDGKIVAEKKDKWRQVNEFLEQIEKTVDFSTFSEQITVVDFGCGNAYLTFCLYFYLNKIKGLDISVVGVDRDESLINNNNSHVKEAGFSNITFICSEVNSIDIGKIDIAVALHACDTATDDALIQAVKSDSKYIFVSPCCHHHLQAHKQVEKGEAISRFPILKERLTDIVTDTARALAIAAKGYTVDIYEFVPDIHTPRNVLIRAVKTGSVNSRDYYNQFIEKWGIVPYIQKIFT